jgi:nucleotide-binding universal stress UspA family protein
LKEGGMNKKIAILVRAGLPYRKTVLYGFERAREIGAKLLLVGVIPELDASRRVALAMHELSSYEQISRRIEQETREFLERVVQFCLDSGVTVETQIERGGIEGVVKEVVKDRNIRLVIVPSPTNKEHHPEFLEAIRHFAHDMIENELRCPVVSVLAT